MVRLRETQLRVPSIALTTALSHVIKAFQNPICIAHRSLSEVAGQARGRLKQIKCFSEAAEVPFVCSVKTK